MASNEIRVERMDGPAGAPRPDAEPALGDLFRALAQDSATLVRQEMALAKAEIKENVRSATKDAVMIAAGGAVLMVGALVLVAFLVLLVGDALNQYWLGALIVGVLFLAVGAFLAKKGLNNLQHDSLAPGQTIQTLKEDKQWLQSEMQQAKRDLA